MFTMQNIGLFFVAHKKIDILGNPRLTQDSDTDFILT